MAHGLPVVSSDLPTSREIMGDFGLYYINGDVNGLARQLHAATQLPWPSKSREAMDIAHRFTMNTIIRQWHNVLFMLPLECHSNALCNRDFENHA